MVEILKAVKAAFIDNIDILRDLFQAALCWINLKSSKTKSRIIVYVWSNK